MTLTKESGGYKKLFTPTYRIKAEDGVGVPDFLLGRIDAAGLDEHKEEQQPRSNVHHISVGSNWGLRCYVV